MPVWRVRARRLSPNDSSPPDPHPSRIFRNGQESSWTDQASDPRRAGVACTAGRPGPGPGGSEHHDFCKAFNAQTEKDRGLIIPAVITVYADRSYSFITKTPPAAVLLKKAAGIQKGSGEPNREKVGKVTRAQLEEIAKMKEPDLNAGSLDAGVAIIAGTARIDGHRGRGRLSA